MSHPIVDLRSDTITRPTSAMREAMAQAEVGDDVFGDDPTVRALEEKVATLLGKEAALFAPSGTMTNQIAIKAHTQPGDEVFIESFAHIYYYEGGGPAALSGVSCHLLTGERGVFTAEELVRAIRPSDVHFPQPRLVCLENTHNRGGGHIWPWETLNSVCNTAKERGLKRHLDGARLWNAAVASGRAEREWASAFDSISVCFSKGLGAPVGSALVGDADFIAKARRIRKMLGGGMRQAGVLAAAALHALDHHRDRLAEDHAHARLLAQAVHQIPGFRVDVDFTETNIVLIHVQDRPAAQVVEELKQRGVLVFATGPETIRAVTHLDVTREQIDAAIQAFAFLAARS